jgi:hypothetical protein
MKDNVVPNLQRMRDAPVLSIRQPWAELILRGKKDVELRTWADKYRGPVWLHTGNKLDEIAAERFHIGALFTGGLVGIAELIEIRRLSRNLYEEWRDRHLDFSPFPSSRDLYGWTLLRARRLDPPRKCKGALGLFHINTSAISDQELELLISNQSPTSGNSAQGWVG